MISKRYTQQYCRDDISMIENYDKAMADTTQTWVCHHRDEVKILPSGMTVIRSRQDLKDAGRYYGCPANELIFLTISEHRNLHAKTQVGERSPRYGKTFDAETRCKLSAANKGKTWKLIDDKRVWFSKEVK